MILGRRLEEWKIVVKRKNCFLKSLFLILYFFYLGRGRVNNNVQRFRLRLHDFISPFCRRTATICAKLRPAITRISTPFAFLRPPHSFNKLRKMTELWQHFSNSTFARGALLKVVFIFLPFLPPFSPPFLNNNFFLRDGLLFADYHHLHHHQHPPCPRYYFGSTLFSSNLK